MKDCNLSTKPLHPDNNAEEPNLSYQMLDTNSVCQVDLLKKMCSTITNNGIIHIDEKKNDITKSALDIQVGI